MALLIALVIHPTIPPPSPPVSGAGGVVCGTGGAGTSGVAWQSGLSAGHGSPVPPLPSGWVPGALGAGVASPPEGAGVAEGVVAVVLDAVGCLVPRGGVGGRAGAEQVGQVSGGFGGGAQERAGGLVVERGVQAGPAGCRLGICHRAVNNLAIQALVATYAQNKTIVDHAAARAAVTEVTTD